MDYILIQWNSNWADEMDVEGFVIMKPLEARNWKINVNRIEEPITICIGTNEEIEYDCGNDLLSEVTFTSITEKEAEVIKKFFGKEGGFTGFISVGE